MFNRDVCAKCGAIWGFDEIQLGRCFACGWPGNEDDDVDDVPEELSTSGFYMTTSEGNTAHITGDPDMPPETLDVLERMIDAAVKQAKGGEG